MLSKELLQAQDNQERVIFLEKETKWLLHRAIIYLAVTIGTLEMRLLTNPVLSSQFLRSQIWKMLKSDNAFETSRSRLFDVGLMR